MSSSNRKVDSQKKGGTSKPSEARSTKPSGKPRSSVASGISSKTAPSRGASASQKPIVSGRNDGSALESNSPIQSGDGKSSSSTITSAGKQPQMANSDGISSQEFKSIGSNLAVETGVDNVVCVPMNVDAFVLNGKVCDSGLTRIAPINQPDYRGLRASNSEIQHDILPHADMHRTQPASVNSRVSAVEAANGSQVDPAQPTVDADSIPSLRTNRVGVYVHWSLPRMYRAATSAADSVDPSQLTTGENVSSSPTFRLVPNRWAVVRKLISSVPASTQKSNLTAWVIESDRMWMVSDLAPDVDLETDVSPFVSYVSGDESDPNTLNKQAAVFIGAKYPATGWTEMANSVPRVPLTIMNSSNFCFADNSIHNPNVFSMVDTFEYTDAQGVLQHYTQASCSYTVIGWHSSADDDPLGPNGLQGRLNDRLKVLFCTLGTARNLIELGLSESPTRLVCYGTILNVQYDHDAKPTTPSDDFGKLFTSSVSMEPVSVGTTALDSVLTFLQAHSANEDDIFGAGSSAVAKDILALRELLYATEDTYNSRIKAADLVYADNFASAAGGNSWHYSARAAPGEPPAQPSTVSTDGSGLSPLDYLNNVNDLQLQLDAASRKLQAVQWNMFALWWKAISDSHISDPNQLASYQTQVVQLRQTASKLNELLNDPQFGLAAQIERIVRVKRVQGRVFLPKVQATSIALPPYFQRKDPTICIVGMDSGWPVQYVGIVPVQFNYFLAAPQTSIVEPRGHVSAIHELAASSTGLDPQIQAALQSILQFAVLSTTDHSADIGFKTWAGQPWCPLYIEWEATYFHIPFEKWSVQILNSPVSNNHDQVRYGINDPLFQDPQSTSDQRTVSGRIILTPQPTVNLQALVAQVLGTAGVTQPSDMSSDDLVQRINSLKLISSELTGLTDNLITLGNGTHVQPNLHIPGEAVIMPLAAAVAAGNEIGLTEGDLVLIGDETAQTPYGNLVDFSKSLKQPFKSVTHGQFRFTKLNIIDKFGQVISGIEPIPDLRIPSGLPDSLHPCLGDQVCPGLIPGTTQLNTVTALTDADPQLPGGYPLCPYVQLTPAINQNCRINAAFLEKTTDSQSGFTGWKTTNDWEQPVWAWLVVNYADYGLQFFNSDGTFYVEMSLGGPTGTIQSTKYLPFDPPSTNNNISPQLDELISKLTDSVYLRSFWDMITQAIETMPYAPADYASYASAIVGKPLALVNVGFSLELATPPLESQTTLPPTTPDGADLKLLEYAFPVKIGDADRPFDGVVGYFDTDNTTTGKTTWEKLFTYFPAPKTTTTTPPAASITDPRVLIEPPTFPTLSPFFVEPDGALKNNSYAASLAENFLVKTMLIDPYTPLHVYSPILPIKELQLPTWTVQVALQTMSAFFKLGPTLITKDVPVNYDSKNPLAADTWAKQQQKSQASPETAPIRLPLLTAKRGEWNWLQPYLISETPTGATAPQEDTRYNALEVGADDGRIRLDPGPYTLIEGFLQLAQPLVVDSVAPGSFQAGSVQS